MANYLVPLMIGAEDMAFPRLNAFAFWINVPAIVLLLTSLYYTWDAGWTLYPPLSLKGSPWLSVGLLVGLSAGLLVDSGFAQPDCDDPAHARPGHEPLPHADLLLGDAGHHLHPGDGHAVDCALVPHAFASQRSHLGMPFFSPILMRPKANMGGYPTLFQHTFWFYSHPAVYVWVLPGLGIISELLPVFARKPLFGYRWIALSSLAIALVGFLVWGHHMFTSGYQPQLRVWFMSRTLLVAVPTGVKFFSWLGTIWGGKLTFPTPMLFALGAISVFLLGGLSGPVLATVASDLPLQDSYFVLGHFHATIFGGFVFPFFAAIYFWFPKITGRMYNERMGQDPLLDHACPHSG